MFLSVTCKNKIAKIYKKPSVQSELISQVLFGEKFIIKKKINKFYKGYSSYDRYPGYVLIDNFLEDKEKKNYRVKIYNLIHNKFFINKFIIKLNKESLENIFNIPIEIQEYTNEMLFNSIEDNYKSIEWLIYNEILDKNWIEFSFMGFHIHNMEFVKKTILIISIITYIYNFVF